MREIRPLSLTAGLTAEEVDGGLLIYDEQDELVLRLNRSAALVWRSSDGNRTVADLVEVLTDELGERADEDQVLVALDELVKHGLIESGYEQRDPNAARISRRHFVRRVGAVAALAAWGVPVVHSMAVPQSASASSFPGYSYCKKHYPHIGNCGPHRPK